MNQFDENNSYETYYTPYEEPEKPKKQKSGFTGKVFRCIALALVFGLVAGTSFSGTSYFFEQYVSVGEEKGEEKSGADLNIAQSTEKFVTDNMSDKENNAGETGAVTDVSALHCVYYHNIHHNGTEFLWAYPGI